jgi:hypothetical protein
MLNRKLSEPNYRHVAAPSLAIVDVIQRKELWQFEIQIFNLA